MSTLTEHVEQLVKELNPCSEPDCDMHECQAARLMTAMAKVCDLVELAEQHMTDSDQIDARLQLDDARRELDALIPKENDHE